MLLSLSGYQSIVSKFFFFFSKLMEQNVCSNNTNHSLLVLYSNSDTRKKIHIALEILNLA